MTETKIQTDPPPAFPDHTQLPDENSTFVKNFQEHPQSILLTDSIGPILQQRHPDGDYVIGQDSGIYWRKTDPPEKGAEAPGNLRSFVLSYSGAPPQRPAILEYMCILLRGPVSPPQWRDEVSGAKP